MPLCLWEGCKLAFEEFAGFQEHVNTKHIQPQRHLNLDKQNDVAMKEEKEMVEQDQMAKLNLDENKMVKKGGGQRKIIFLAVEVWVDVLDFVRRIQLARSVCFINWKIYEICWPFLHGNRVMAHDVWSITIGYRHEFGQPPTALLLQGSKELAFPECPPPDYITGFRHIRIDFLNHQVLAFLALIAPRISENQVKIEFTTKMSDLDEKQVASINQLFQLCREKLTTIHSILFPCSLSNIQFLPDVDNKMKIIRCYGIEESNIPILMHFLASPRSDGQQRVMKMHFREGELPMAQKVLDAIKKEFRTSTQPLPQPFYIRCFYHRPQNLNIPQSGEENVQTLETLTIMPNPTEWRFDICRHPLDQHEQWAENENARNRLIDAPINSTTYINLGILEFGVPFSMNCS